MDIMISIGLNGFGRIGKCVFLQLIYNNNIDIKVINAPDYDINNLESYLKRDSVHQYNKNFSITITKVFITNMIMGLFFIKR